MVVTLTSEAATDTVVTMRSSLVTFLLTASTCYATGFGSIAKVPLPLLTRLHTLRPAVIVLEPVMIGSVR